jgi:hypothetical protein
VAKTARRAVDVDDGAALFRADESALGGSTVSGLSAKQWSGFTSRAHDARIEAESSAVVACRAVQSASHIALSVFAPLSGDFDPA